MPPPAPPTPQRRTALRRLDDTLVPRLRPLARGVARVVGAPARVLRALDDRLAGGRLADRVQSHSRTMVFVVAALAFAATAVHAQRFPELDDTTESAAGRDPGQAAGGVEDDGGVIDAGPGAVGPSVGEDVADYLDAATSRLEGASGPEPRVAVISFADFQDPETAAQLLGDVTVHMAMYQLPEREPRPQRLDVDSGLVTSVRGRIDEIVQEIQVEEGEVASTIESGVEDPEFLADYEARLDELRGMRNILQQHPEIVYAVVVSADPATLRQIADEDAVRVVDVGVPGADVETTAVAGLLPQDRETVRTGLAG